MCTLGRFRSKQVENVILGKLPIDKNARACLGEKGYNLFFNNCEHFANMCTLGRFRSKQVENVILGKLPIDKNNKGEGKMGLFSKVGNAIKGLFGRGSSSSGSRTTSSTTYEPDKVKIAEIEASGSRTTSSTTYEPDKVKIAEIEADAKIRAAHLENDRVELMKQAQLETLQFETEMKIAVEQAKAQGFNVMAKTIVEIAHLENDRVELMKQAQLETLQFETEMKIAVEQAKAQGFNVMAKTIVEMRSKMNEIAEKRLEIIEKGSLGIIKEIEAFYDELGDKIEDDNNRYNTEQLPKNEIAEKRLEIIEKGSLGIIKEIEAFYDELGDKIEDDNNRYNTEQLPKLLSILENYEEGTSQHKLYSKKIDMDMEAQMKHYLSQINNIAERQNLISA